MAGDREALRRAAARALDTYIASLAGGGYRGEAFRTDRAIDFVEAMGDYVIQRMSLAGSPAQQPDWCNVAPCIDCCAPCPLASGELSSQQNGHYGVSLVGPLCVHGFVADGQACGQFGCTELAPRNPDYGVPRCPVDGQFCSTCRIGGGNGDGGECARTVKPDYGVCPTHAVPLAADGSCDGCDRAANGVCDGHGAHPHGGRRCLDCPICIPENATWDPAPTAEMPTVEGP